MSSNVSQEGLTGRELWRWLMEHGIPKGKRDGQPARVMTNISNKEKSREEDQEAEGRCSSQKAQILAWFSDSELSSQRTCQVPKRRSSMISWFLHMVMFPQFFPKVTCSH